MKVKIVGIGKERDMKSKKGVDFRAFNLFVTHQADSVTGLVAESLFVTDFNQSVYNKAKSVPVNVNADIYFDRGGYIEDIIVEK